MKILIVGAGRVGTSVAENLVSEHNDITVIDPEPSRLSDLQERFDLRGVVGDGSQLSAMQRAGAEDADMLIACAASDSVNLVACKIARQVFNVQDASRVSVHQKYPPCPSCLVKADSVSMH